MKGSYKDLKVWQKAHSQTLKMYRFSSQFPSEEKYGIVNQIRRSAISVELNIVEGKSRQSAKEFIHFLYISRGSNQELHCLLNLCIDLNYIEESDGQNLISACEEVNKMLNGLIKSLKK